MYRTLLVLMMWMPFAASATPAPRIEVVFALDATGSMGPWIKEARERIRAIADDLASGQPQPDVRFALVNYRDRGDAYVTKKHPFTRDIEEMRGWLDATRAQGGGDSPEAVLEALQVAIDDLDWTASSDQGVIKLVYLVGDASPQRYTDGPDEDAMLVRALQKGIVIHSIACGRMGSSGQAFFERVARLSEGRPFRLRQTLAARRAKGPRVVSAAGASGAVSLASAVSGTARAYSGTLGVDFAAKRTPLIFEALPGIEDGAESGLLGRQLRVVSDTATWTDVWAAHSSVRPIDERVAPPKVDFTTHQVLVLGGADVGLKLAGFEATDAARVARVEPALPGVRFAFVPAAETAIVSEGGVL